MKSLRLGLIALLLSACGQEKLQVDKDQVFSKQFPADKLTLGHDDGRAVSIRAIRNPGSGGSGHGFVSQDYFGGCDSIYGCDRSPFSYWTGFSNFAHAWNPGISRTVNLNFGRRPTAIDPLAFPAPVCVNLQITSNRQLQVLRFNAYDGVNQNSVSGSGSNTISVQVQTSRIGQLIFAVVDQQALYEYCPNQYQPTWGPQNWWDWQWDWHQPQYPNCGAPQQQATLRITGTVGACSSPEAVRDYNSSSAGGGIDLSSRINIQSGYDPYTWYFQQNQTMPYFRDATGSLWGRVLNYDGGAGVNFWGL